MAYNKDVFRMAAPAANPITETPFFNGLIVYYGPFSFTLENLREDPQNIDAPHRLGMPFNHFTFVNYIRLPKPSYKNTI